MNDLAALRAVDLNWTTHLDSIWDDRLPDVPDIQSEARNLLSRKLDALISRSDSKAPLGQIIIGTAGSGKTHLLGSLRREALDRGCSFLSVDLSNVSSFWDTVLLGAFKSIMKPGCTGQPQYVETLEGIVELCGDSLNVSSVSELRELRPPRLNNRIRTIIGELAKRDMAAALEHQDVVRALVLLGSTDFELMNIGYAWLQSLGVNDQTGFHHDFRNQNPEPPQVVKGLGWLLSLRAPLVLSFDQMDNIVREHQLASGQEDTLGDPFGRQQASLSIVEGIAGGLMSLRDLMPRTMLVVSCLESTWSTLRERSIAPVAGRYEAPTTLRPLDDHTIAMSLLEARTIPAYRSVGFEPPYPTWPIQEEALREGVGLYPREVLRRCGEHVEACLLRHEVRELQSLSGAADAVPVPNTGDAFTDQFDRARARFEVGPVLEPNAEEAQDALIEALCDTLAVEVILPTDKDAEVTKTFTTNKSYDPLHALIRIVHHDKGDRERCLGFRFLQSKHPSAFQARLKAAMTESGIDRALGFRRLILFRTTDVPSGPVTARLMDTFGKRGGILLNPGTEDLATLWALGELWKTTEDLPGLKSWLRDKKPIHSMAMLSASADWLFSSPSVAGGSEAATSESSPKGTRPLHASEAESHPEHRQPGLQTSIPLGEAYSGAGKGPEVAVSLGQLTNHTVILAGSGSGKTVFLKRLVEESALAGVPSIVIDGANDLACLGDPWPAEPNGFREADRGKAARYFDQTEAVVFTPGREAGRSLQLNPIPDLSSIRDAPDEYAIAKEITRGSLVEMLQVTGRSVTTKTALIDRALDVLAESDSSSLRDLLAVLTDPPSTVLEGYDRAGKLVRELADELRARMQMDRLLQGDGTSLDPSVLFGLGRHRTRISVLNFIGIPDLEGQRTFLDQLARILFVWIKKNPAPDGTIRGLMVIDEAKDFVPAAKAVACRESFRRLAAQARKYGLGLVFASQEPRSIDHTIISNAKTLLFGKVNSPAAIAAAQQQIRDRGGDGSDVARLKAGCFYAYSEGMSAPQRIATPYCLSNHPSSPLTEEAVLNRSRRPLAEAGS